MVSSNLTMEPTSAQPKEEIPCMDRMDAARALLTVSPGISGGLSQILEHSTEGEPSASAVCLDSREKDALSALASIASNVASLSADGNSSDGWILGGGHGTSSSDEDAETMPPPPPRRIGRLRSASNPEGMEKWDSLSRSGRALSSRRHFVLPSAILEEELASVSSACEQEAASFQDERDGHGNPHVGGLPLKKRGIAAALPDYQDLSTSPSSVVLPVPPASSQHAGDAAAQAPAETEDLDEDRGSGAAVVDMTDSNQEDVESMMDPTELLRRARSRLLDDMTAAGGSDKGVLPLPHSLAKYKEVYNKNGRIGIYTPAERAAIIAKFNQKRSRRVWNKKIRYNCRKNLADRRMRFKGRFVKRTATPPLETAASTSDADVVSTEGTPHNATSTPSTENFSPSDSAVSSRSTSPSGVAERSVQMSPKASGERSLDVDMPDVNDPEAGFEPTEDQPYRRTRRHTIT